MLLLFLSPSLLSFSLSLNFALDIVLSDRQSVRPFIVPLLVLVLLFCQKKNRASSSRSYDCSLQRFLFLLRDFRRFISGRTRRNHGDLIACFPFFTIALFKFLRFLPYNRMPRPRLFCANDEDGEYTTTVLPKRPPSPVRFVTRYLNRVVSVSK